MNKKLIRLTENDLHKIVKESVRRILRENKANVVYNPNNLHPVSVNTTTNNTYNQYDIPYEQGIYDKCALSHGYVKLSDGKFYQKGYGMDEDGDVIDARQLVPLENDAMGQEYLNQAYQEALRNDPRYKGQYDNYEKQHALDYEKQELERAKIEAEKRKYDRMYK